MDKRRSRYQPEQRQRLMPIGKHRIVAATADAADAAGGPVTLFAIQITANGANLDLQICNSLTDDSSYLLQYHVLDGNSFFADYSVLSGIFLSVGMTLDIQGSGGQVVCFCS